MYRKNKFDPLMSSTQPSSGCPFRDKRKIASNISAIPKASSPA